MRDAIKGHCANVLLAETRKTLTCDCLSKRQLKVFFAIVFETLRDREQEIEQLKTTLRRVRDTLGPVSRRCEILLPFIVHRDRSPQSRLSEENRWKSCDDDLGRVSPTTKYVDHAALQSFVHTIRSDRRVHLRNGNASLHLRLKTERHRRRFNPRRWKRRFTH